MKKIQLSLVIMLCIHVAWSQHSKATIKVYDRQFKTYAFSDPDPVVRMGGIYPYYRFDGYTDKSVSRNWKVVELENAYIKVMILPEIGGKIWGAWEKSTGKPFIYFNHVIKFRDVALRGPWTSGGIEANYGIIGHTPNCATPVDYLTEVKDDGSVSCYIGTLDLLTQTYWTIEINLPADRAYFTTRSFWHNSTPLVQSYYTWMNVGIKAAGNLQFIYPGNQYLGHGGEHAEWNIHEETKKDISYYNQNDFGGYKSYHVFGRYTDFFGAYWHDDHFGMVRYSTHDDKPGKKIWIWGLSRQGMIWENLLTDTDGQYVEVQSGRLFNQAATQSTQTPFKHRGFTPATTDEWTEYWYPVKNTEGFVVATALGALNLRSRGGYLKIDFSPVQDFEAELKIVEGGHQVYAKEISFKTLEAYSDSVVFIGNTAGLDVVLGGLDLQYRVDSKEGILGRPVDSPENFDWNSVYGLYLQGKEYVRQRSYPEAIEKLKGCLVKDPNFLPALDEMAMLMYLNMEYDKSLDYAKWALRIDTYDPAGNFYYGLANARLGRLADAKDGFDIAASSTEFRCAAYTELSKVYFNENNLERAQHYAKRSLEVNSGNSDGYQLLAAMYRRSGEKERAYAVLEALTKLSPLNHFIRFERYLWEGSNANKEGFETLIRNELPHESYLQLADWYYSAGLKTEALRVLQLAPEGPVVLYWIAFLRDQLNDGDAGAYIDRANTLSPELVFPFRSRTAEVLRWVIGQTDHWKPRYYLGLIVWNRDDTSQARELFRQCGNPDFSYFYCARALLMEEDNLYADIKKAAQLNPGEWRFGKLLIDHYIKDKVYSDALDIARQYNSRFAGDYRIQIELARTLLLNKQYGECTDLLSGIHILPYEGATGGRRLYRYAWLMQAVGQLKSGRYKSALNSIHKATLWPETLGVGKPYEEDVDERLENYMQGICYEKMNRSDRALAKWEEIISFKGASADVNRLVTALALRKANRSVAGEELLVSWLENEPKNRLAHWCLETYRGNPVRVEMDGEEGGDAEIVRQLLESR